MAAMKKLNVFLVLHRYLNTTNFVNHGMCNKQSFCKFDHSSLVAMHRLILQLDEFILIRPLLLSKSFLIKDE